MPKFKIGQKVRVDLSNYKREEDKVNCTSGMWNLNGKEIVIEVHNCDDYPCGEDWVWQEEWLRPIRMKPVTLKDLVK